MPTYEYECQACKKKHEEFQSINDPPLKKCPYCGRNKLTKLIGAGAGLLFKGSGFYVTDYRSSEYKDKAKSDASATGKDSGSTSGSKTESKSSSTSESKGDSSSGSGGGTSSTKKD